MWTLTSPDGSQVERYIVEFECRARNITFVERYMSVNASGGTGRVATSASCFGGLGQLYRVKVWAVSGPNISRALVFVTGGQWREEGRRAIMHGVNMLCVFIRIHYFTTGFQLVAKVMHLLPIHASCKTETYSDKYYFNLLIHVFFPIVGLAPATAVNTETPTTPATAVNTETPTTPATAVNTATPTTPATAVNTVTLTTPTTAVNTATPTGPHPSSTGNIIVQFDGLCLCIVSDRKTINDVYIYTCY